MKKVNQMSDSLLIGALLAVVGGFLDAYTYLCRGEVFANAQTGNIVLLGIRLMEGNYIRFFYYLLPILSFVVGIFVAEVIKNAFRYHRWLHWRQLIICIEMIVLCIVMCIPQGNLDTLCNIMISFVCSLQVQGFRKFHGNPYASTMCTGNLRSATQHLYQYFQNRQQASLHTSLKYYFIIFCFIVGASLGSLLTNKYSIVSLILCVILLFVVDILMFKKEESV